MQNYFEFFNLPEQFAVDSQALDKAYKEIQKLVHPDRFVTATEAEKRTAMQWAAMANDAYQTLRDPVRRSSYLCELNGYDVRKETHVVSMDPEFLMQQLEWRESLQKASETGNRPMLEKLAEELHRVRRRQMEIVENSLNRHEFENAVQETRKMMFLEKFGEEIGRTFNELDSGH